MNCRTESERFCLSARRKGQNRRRRSQSYVEDDFGLTNAAEGKTSLNAKAFCWRFLETFDRLIIIMPIFGIGVRHKIGIYFGKGLEMKMKKVLFYLLAAVIGGCVPSLHPLYTDKDVVFDDALLGKWESDASNDPNWVWQFDKGTNNSYDLTLTDKEGKGKFIVYLVRLDKMQFLDLYPSDPETLKTCILWNMHVIPAHTFIKVEQTKPAFKIRFMEPDTVGEMLIKDPNLVKHEIIEHDGTKGVVLTASTEDLQRFIKAHANDKDFFGEIGELKRVVVTDANQPQAIDPNSRTNKDKK